VSAIDSPIDPTKISFDVFLKSWLTPLRTC